MKPLSLLFVLSLVFAHCAPAPIVNFNVLDSDNTYWIDGQEIALESTCGIDAHMAYSHHTDDHIFFDVVLENNGDDTFLIDPSTILVTDLLSRNEFLIIDPEAVILQKRKEASRREARDKTLDVVGAAALTGAVIATASAGQQPPQQNTGFGGTNVVFVENGPTEYVPFKSQGLLSVAPELLPHVSQLAFWQECALRKTTLKPTYSMRGLLVVEDYPALRKFQLELQACDYQPMQFTFHKVLIKP